MDQRYELALKTGFASHYAFLVKSQNYHWNTVGRHFYQDHLLLERIYTEVEESVDPFAENLRKVGLFAPAGVGQLSELSVVEDASEVPVDSVAMIASLADDADKLVALFRMLFEIAEEHRDHGLSNFLADRQDAYSQHSWMLRSSLK